MKFVSVLAASAIVLSSTSAFAGGFGHGQSQGQGQGQAQGQMQGQGQAQGQSQNAYAGAAAGAAAYSANKNTNVNYSANTNQNYSSNKNSNSNYNGNSNNNFAAGGSASANNSNNANNSANNSSNNSSNNSANNSSNNASRNSNSVTVEGDNYEAAASSAYAPGLTAGVNPCALSYSGGVSAMDFGFALGGVVNSEGCEDRANIATLMGIGEREAAVAYACLSNKTMAKALGDRCPKPEVAAAPAGATPTTFSAQVADEDLSYTPATLGGGKLRNRK